MSSKMLARGIAVFGVHQLGSQLNTAAQKTNSTGAQQAFGAIGNFATGMAFGGLAGGAAGLATSFIGILM